MNTAQWISLVVVAVSVIVIIGLYLITGTLGGEKISRKDVKMDLVKTFSFLIHAIMVFGITTFLSQTLFFQTWATETLSGIMSGSFVSEDYLRKHFSPDLIRKFRSASIKALSISDLDDKEDSFLYLTENSFLPMLDEPIRRDYDLTLQHEIVGNTIKETSVTTWTYENHLKNAETEPLQYPQRFVISSKKMTPDQLSQSDKVDSGIITLEYFRVGGMDVTKDLCFTEGKISDAQHIVRESEYKIKIGKAPVKVEIKMIQTLPLDDYVARRMPVATKGIRIKYIHDKEMIPTLYYFNSKETKLLREPSQQLPNITEWSSPEWFLRGNGLILEWKINIKDLSSQKTPTQPVPARAAVPRSGKPERSSGLGR